MHRSAQKFSRRKFIQTGIMSGTALCVSGCLVKKPPQFVAAPSSPAALPGGLRVNDVHSQLNSALVREISVPGSIDECQSIVENARRHGKAVCVAGGRHSMGGQQ